MKTEAEAEKLGKALFKRMKGGRTQETIVIECQVR